MRIFHAPILLCAAALTACVAVTPDHVPLPAQARAGISSTEVVLPVSQSELYIDVPASHISTATGGGLLPALIDAGIDSARASSAAKAVKPLNDAVVDFNFDTMLADQVRQSMAATDGIHVDTVRVIKDASAASMDQALAASKDGAVLIAITNYHLANDGGSLWIEVHAGLYKNGAGPKPAGAGGDSPSAPANALYRNTFWFTTTVPEASANRDHNISVWSADHGARLRADLKRGALKVSQLMISDIQATDATPGIVTSPDGALERKADGTEVFRAN
jgi:hypothetical protein